MSDDTEDDDFFLDDDVIAGEDDGAWSTAPWKILVVDDEDDVHQVTSLALRGFSFLGRGITFLSAKSAAEARQAVEEQNDIALILLDVVMEEDHAGLDFARWLREDRGVKDTRIILRTGQPGQAPERQVVLAFDINDYKAKSELTAERLYAAVVTALRGYDELAENKRLREELLTMLATQGIAEQALMDVLPFPVVIVDPLDQVGAVNSGMAKVCGTPLEELVGQSRDTGLPKTLASALSETGVGPRLIDVGGVTYHLLKRDISTADGAHYGTVACLVPEGVGT